MDWTKFAIAFFLCVLAPIWFLPNFFSVTFLWKIGFTIAGAIGVFWALEYGAIGRRH